MTGILLDPAEVAARHALAARGGDLGAIAARLAGHLDAVMAQPIYVPDAKALLSRWGSHCRDDEAPLLFDPWSPNAQRCSRCGRAWSTEQSHRWWIYWYQLWLAERVWLLALHSGPGGRPGAAERALATLEALAARYLEWPNADNVLGPGRPFFSTYLESIWVLHLAAAASLLDAGGLLPAGLARDLRARLFRPSAEVIADFPEGRSNRQVWNSAALLALGGVLEDDAMTERAARGPEGVLATLDSGLLGDGLWYEGENYHWFALRGLVWGAGLLQRAGGPDLWRDAGDHGARFRAAFRAPVATALPDFTHPARRDSKFGVTLRQRRMAELWEVALACDAGSAPWYSSLLRTVYDSGGDSPPDDLPSAVTEVEHTVPVVGAGRNLLGWRAWLHMVPELPASDVAAWPPESAHLEATGLAIVRKDEGQTYVSLDYGESGGGHGHPDRLNLTLVNRGVPWLLDFGTGSYVSPSLAWYRTTLAHNAPLVDALSQAPARGHCVAWDEAGEWAWICAQVPENTAYDGVLLQRTVIVGDGYLLDITQMASSSGERQLALPWHGLGRAVMDEDGVTFTKTPPPGGETLRVRLAGRQRFSVSMQRGAGPPAPAGPAEELEFAIPFSQGEEVTLAACLDLGAGVAHFAAVEDGWIVGLGEEGERVHTHRATDEGWEVELDRGDPVQLSGLRELPEPAEAAQSGARGIAVPGGRYGIGAVLAQPPAVHQEAAAGRCIRAGEAPLMDGSLAGFDAAAALLLNDEAQFRRAEAPWEGEALCSARALLNHDGDTLYVGVEVVAPSPWFRPGEVPNPEWENENPDIHSDGVQLFIETPVGLYGWLAVPDPGSAEVRVARVKGTDSEPEMLAAAAWQPTPTGYTVVVALLVPDALEGEFGFDLMVNRAHEARERRTGQLVWSGARGARLYLAGDRPMSGSLPRIRVE